MNPSTEFHIYVYGILENYYFCKLSADLYSRYFIGDSDILLNNNWNHPLDLHLLSCGPRNLCRRAEETNRRNAGSCAGRL